MEGIGAGRIAAERIAVFGATSGIARALAEEWLSRGEELLLIGRKAESLAALARDLEVLAGRPCPTFVWDVTDFAGHERRFGEMLGAHAVKGLFMAAGVHFTPEECRRDPAKTRSIFDVNLTGPAMVMDLFAAHFAGRKQGFISCLSSVAGDRGRGSNYAYGASKAGLSAFLQGLRNRLQGSGVLVQTVKPGMVRTPMTARLRSPLLVAPRGVARHIAASIRRRRDIIYSPRYWRLIMFVIRSIPEPLFKRLKL